MYQKLFEFVVIFRGDENIANICPKRGENILKSKGYQEDLLADLKKKQENANMEDGRISVENIHNSGEYENSSAGQLFMRAKGHRKRYWGASNPVRRNAPHVIRFQK